MSHDLSRRYPLVVPGIEAIQGLSDTPGPPVSLSESERAAWERMPLSKRRLAVYGPEAGTTYSRRAAIILASECRAQGLTQETALRLCQAIPYTTGSSTGRHFRRQIETAVRFAYDAPPLLSGCCRDPRAKPLRPTSGAMRDMMAPFCDHACAASCSMLRAIRNPEKTVADTEYAHIDTSDLWMHGSGYGQAGRFAYRQLALLATLTTDKIVEASASYITRLAEGEWSLRHFRRVLKQLSDDGLAPVLMRKDGIPMRYVPVLSAAQVEKLEQTKAVKGKRAANIREALAAQEQLADRHWETFSGDERIAAWSA